MSTTTKQWRNEKMGIDEAYMNEEELIINDETMTEEQKSEVLRELYLDYLDYQENR